MTPLHYTSVQNAPCNKTSPRATNQVLYHGQNVQSLLPLKVWSTSRPLFHLSDSIWFRLHRFFKSSRTKFCVDVLRSSTGKSIVLQHLDTTLIVLVDYARFDLLIQVLQNSTQVHRLLSGFGECNVLRFGWRLCNHRLFSMISSLQDIWTHILYSIFFLQHFLPSRHLHIQSAGGWTDHRLIPVSVLSPSFYSGIWIFFLTSVQSACFGLLTCRARIEVPTAISGLEFVDKYNNDPIALLYTSSCILSYIPAFLVCSSDTQYRLVYSKV